ncbi:MAG: NADH:flavin oxidoreductase [Synergistaceae bacterium]|jgi:2,4-dienoyl-CoA reductase-like NADH-dependent reductase (Old Yellow Enzyme family)|nr:NADH:flavin oxidoreductase [Synergistaceae bacterium]
MKTLFDETTIGQLPVKNRFVRAAVADQTSDGYVGDSVVETYERLAASGIGSIVTGITLVDGEEKFMPVAALCSDSFVPGHRRVTEAVHRHNCVILAQLVYIGSYVFTQGNMGGLVALAPSSVANLVTGTLAREMRAGEIRMAQDKFAETAKRAKAAGYDGVEIHAAHGFLLSQFLTPHYNQRMDLYGGSAENRARMVLETYSAIRNAVGPGYPVWIKLNSMDGIPDGISNNDFKYVCRRLTNLGIDAIEVSGNWSPLALKSGAYFKEAAAAIAEENDVSVILTGGNRKVSEMTSILNSTGIGFFGMARPLIRNHLLIEKFRRELKGELEEERPPLAIPSLS